MSSQRYKRLLTNLPSMAAVVNAFQSPEVQLSVYRTLIDAMEEALTEGDSREWPSHRTSAAAGPRHSGNGKLDPGPLADVVEGESIHAVAHEC
jgi:hypothetical protein